MRLHRKHHCPNASLEPLAREYREAVKSYSNIWEKVQEGDRQQWREMAAREGIPAKGGKKGLERGLREGEDPEVPDEEGKESGKEEERTPISPSPYW